MKIAIVQKNGGKIPMIYCEKRGLPTTHAGQAILKLWTERNYPLTKDRDAIFTCHKDKCDQGSLVWQREDRWAGIPLDHAIEHLLHNLKVDLKMYQERYQEGFI